MEIQNPSDRLIDASDDVLCREIKELVAAWEAHNNDSENDAKALVLAKAVYRLQGNLSINGLQRSEVKTFGGEHTPGPWEVNDDRFWVRSTQTGSIVATVEKDLHHKGEQAANAHLIASAPELLEALVSLLDVSDFATNSRIGEIHLHCMAVIAQGGGR